MTAGQVDKGGRLTADVVVVGGGGAGMAAALRSRQLGLSVILVEKAQQVGGTTGLSVGTIMAAGGHHQKSSQIHDTPERHAADLAGIAQGMNLGDNPEIRKLLTENVADTVSFLEAAGVRFLAPLPQPPHKADRLHQVMPTSRAYVYLLERELRRLGVQILTSAPMRRILSEGGRVVGVEVEMAGRRQAVLAVRGVVLASGDIGGDRQMMRTHMKTAIDAAVPYNPANTGDGQRLAAEIGAKIASRPDMPAELACHIRFPRPGPSWLHKIPPHPFVTRMMVNAYRVLPQALIRPFLMGFLTTTLGPDRGVFEQGAIVVNQRGERFSDELKDLNYLLPDQPEGKGYIIFDEKFACKFSQWPHFISTAPGVAFAFLQDYRRGRPDLFFQEQSLAALADRIGADRGALERSVDRANADRAADKKIEQGPFYALGPLQLWVMVAQVGLTVDSQLRVLDEGNQAIPGLYAAGGAGQGGFTISGHGHGLGWAFTSGRLAAESVAKSTSARQGAAASVNIPSIQ
ncbi:FAD-dependent oxidoreductase [Paraburkholderia phymatum]|uniref:FAD-dependent oxidoreductase n=1 Tax=Paraburkholderia phymatum TaxID=148447 RepID=UPI003175C9E7